MFPRYFTWTLLILLINCELIVGPPHWRQRFNNRQKKPTTQPTKPSSPKTKQTTKNTKPTAPVTLATTAVTILPTSVATLDVTQLTETIDIEETETTPAPAPGPITTSFGGTTEEPIEGRPLRCLTCDDCDAGGIGFNFCERLDSWCYSLTTYNIDKNTTKKGCDSKDYCVNLDNHMTPTVCYVCDWHMCNPSEHSPWSEGNQIGPVSVHLVLFLLLLVFLLLPLAGPTRQ